MPEKRKKTASKNQPVIINQIKVGQLNRQKLDIEKWDRALKSAESVTSPKRKQLYELYNNIMVDGFLTSLISKRINAVRTAPIKVECENEQKKERIELMLKTPWFYELLGYTMEARFWGHSLIEITVQEGEIIKSELIPRHHVNPEKGIIAFDSSNMDSGIPYREEPYDRFLLEVGTAKDLGLLKSLAPYVIYKRGNLSDYAQFNELFGQPLRSYEYDPTITGQREEVSKQAETMGASAFVVMPKGTEVKFHQSSGISASATYKDFHGSMNEEMTITVLGQTLTTSSNKTGSWALGMVHQDVQESIHLEDRVWCLYVLNWDFKWMLQQLGFDVEGIEFQFDDTKRLPVKDVLDILIKMAPFMPIPTEEVFKLLNLPPPTPEQIKAFEQQKAAQPAQLSYNKRVELLYQDAPHGARGKQIALSFEDDITAVVERIIQQLHKGELKAGDVDPELYKLLADELYKAVEEGFGAELAKLEVGTTRYEMLSALRDNVHVFSGAKTYQELKAFSELLVDDSGAVRSFSSFREEVLKLHQQYNQHFLYTEYTQAVGNSQIADKWVDIQAQKEALPYLKFRAVMDANTRHGKFNGLTLPVDDPAWDYMMPLLGWGCRCTVSQLADATVTKPESVPEPEVLPAQFRFNPGKEQALFSKQHPYYEVQRADQARLKNNFGLPMPE